MTYMKYPRTHHLPWSQVVTRDDKMLKDVSVFHDEDVVVTIKMDGENTSLYFDGYIHSRSIDYKNHSSRHWVKQFWSAKFFQLPNNYRICGENLFAKHSIFYDQLDSYFYGFSIWNDQRCLSWTETMMWFDALEITPVQVIYQGVWNEKVIQSLSHIIHSGNEGYVVRKTGEFTIQDFSSSVAKFVRPQHVQTHQHWMHEQIVQNRLRFD